MRAIAISLRWPIWHHIVRLVDTRGRAVRPSCRGSSHHALEFRQRVQGGHARMLVAAEDKRITFQFTGSSPARSPSPIKRST